jgi:hypothetical protein
MRVVAEGVIFLANVKLSMLARVAEEGFQISLNVGQSILILQLKSIIPLRRTCMNRFIHMGRKLVVLGNGKGHAT